MKSSLFAFCVFYQSIAFATFSIITCDESSGVCGAAVATDNLAVGASVIHVQAGVGAIASQFETHPLHGPVGLPLLSNGQVPNDALSQLLKGDNQFDGGSIHDRQLAIIDAFGNTAVHTGENAKSAMWSGSHTLDGVSVQGNSLANNSVLNAMLMAFKTSKGDLASRLMLALEAGHKAGGQSSGIMSAALLVRTPEGFPFDIDLRVDANRQAIKELRCLLNLYQARESVIDAQRLATKDPEKARELLNEAMTKAAGWDRVVKRGIQVALVLEDKYLISKLQKQLEKLEAIDQ